MDPVSNIVFFLHNTTSEKYSESQSDLVRQGETQCVVTTVSAMLQTMLSDPQYAIISSSGDCIMHEPTTTQSKGTRTHDGAMLMQREINIARVTEHDQ